MNTSSTPRFTTEGDEGAGGGDDSEGYKIFEKLVIGSILTFITLLAFLGNLLVVVAVFTDRRLKRRKSNFLIMSLAMADICVSIMVMTFAIINDVHGKWLFGKAFCLIWVCFDIMMCTCSILNLCVICLDRFLQIKFPLHYMAWMSTRMMVLLIVAVWSLSAFMSFVPLHMGWHLPPPEARAPDDPYLCILDISFAYALGSSSISFYIPCIFMLAVYCQMFLLARSHAKVIGQTRIPRSLETVQTKSLSMTEMRLKTDHKAAVTLGIIMGTFLFCWLPFFIINPIAAKCADCVPIILFQVFTWLGYANSCANPIIYSLYNSEFRNAFRRMLLMVTTSTAMSTTQELTRTTGHSDRSAIPPYW